MTPHYCHAHGCSRSIPPRLLMCAPHWYALPEKIRKAIWREFRPGQENDKRPSDRYMAVQRIAVAHSAFRPHDAEASTVAARYVAEAIQWQERSVRNGHGDPLEGLVPRGVAL